MYNYIIIDDEPLIRMGTLKKLEALSDKIYCIGQADNGKEAIALVEKHAPDIIILDMEMPVMNGTRLLTHLAEHYPEIQLIVISGYKNFDYIKHAIASNVIDYILKPFTSEQIQQTMLQALKRIETSESIHNQIRISEDEKENAYYEHDIQFLQNLILNYPSADTDIHSQKLSFLRSATRFCLLLLCTTAPAESLKLEEHLNELGFSEIALFLPHPSNPNLSFFLLSVSAEANYKPHIFYLQFIKEFTTYIETLCSLAYWGVSNLLPEIEQLSHAYEQACTALSFMPIIQTQSAYYIYDSLNTLTSHEICWKKTNEFLFRAESGMVEQVHELLLELQDFYFSLPDLTLADIRYHYHQLTESCLLILKQYLNRPSPSGSMQRIVNEIFSIQELHDYYARFFENLTEMLKPKSIYAKHDTIEQIKIYTQRNYQKNLTVDFLASLFYLNSSYLSHLFRRQTGQKYVHYLNDIRIQKAKELILTTDRKLYQIARAVGYDNSKYFFRVFKKWVGMTPEQYRTSHHTPS